MIMLHTADNEYVTLNLDQGVQLINCILHCVEYFTRVTFNSHFASPSLPHSNDVLHTTCSIPTNQHTLSYKLCPYPKRVHIYVPRFVSSDCRLWALEHRSLMQQMWLFYEVFRSCSKIFFSVIQIYVLRTSLCYTIRRMCSIYASKRLTLLLVGRN